MQTFIFLSSFFLSAVRNGLGMGDFHNSKNFFFDFLPYVFEEVKSLCHKFLTTRTPQTGLLPCVNIQADKGTSCHRTMQFSTCVVAVANSDYLLANMFLGHPIVKDGSAEGLAQLICDVVEEHGILPQQLEGFTPGLVFRFVIWFI